MALSYGTSLITTRRSRALSRTCSRARTSTSTIGGSACASASARATRRRPPRPAHGGPAPLTPLSSATSTRRGGVDGRWHPLHHALSGNGSRPMWGRCGASTSRASTRTVSWSRTRASSGRGPGASGRGSSPSSRRTTSGSVRNRRVDLHAIDATPARPRRRRDMSFHTGARGGPLRREGLDLPLPPLARPVTSQPTPHGAHHGTPSTREVAEKANNITPTQAV